MPGNQVVEELQIQELPATDRAQTAAVSRPRGDVVVHGPVLRRDLPQHAELVWHLVLRIRERLIGPVHPRHVRPDHPLVLRCEAIEGRLRVGLRVGNRPGLLVGLHPARVDLGHASERVAAGALELRQPILRQGVPASVVHRLGGVRKDMGHTALVAVDGDLLVSGLWGAGLCTDGPRKHDEPNDIFWFHRTSSVRIESFTRNRPCQTDPVVIAGVRPDTSSPPASRKA